jgi:large subunit ribosomal protein L4
MAARRAGAASAKPAPVAADLFGEPLANPEILHRALRTHAQNARQGTQHTKTRGEVAFSTVKLYRQKGTGRARVGSSGSNLRRGGGVAFGPRTRTIDRRMSRRDRRLALRSLLASKAGEQRVLRAGGWGDSASTKDRAAWLAAADLTGRVLLIDVEPTTELRRSAHNLPGVLVARADSIGFFDLAVADHIVATDEAITVLQGKASDGSG